MDFHRHLNQRAEAERWLSTAVKLLTTRDLHGTKSFAIRARESDPRLGATDQLIAVADTLLAEESRINNQPDWYAILQLGRRTSSIELVATQYRRLALLLNPQANRFPFADQAFRLVSDAWTVLSNPSNKAYYDHHLNLFDSPPQPQPPPSSQLFERQFLQMHAQPLQQQPLFYQQISQQLRPPIAENQPSPPPQQQPIEQAVQPRRYRNTENQPSPQQQSIEQTVQPLRYRNTENQPSPQQQPIEQTVQPPRYWTTENQPSPQQQPIEQTVQPPRYRTTENQPSPQQQPIEHTTEPPRSRITKNQPSPQQQQQHSPQPLQPPIIENQPSPPQQQPTEQAVQPSRPRITENQPSPQWQPVSKNTRNKGDGDNAVSFEADSANFWTACPYCYHLFEYSRVYEECMLRCQNCKRGFQAVVISSPPVMDNGEANFCCWAYYPMGISATGVKDTSTWSPFSTMFACPLPPTKNKVGRPKKAAVGPRLYRDDYEEDADDISDPSEEESDDEWHVDKRRNKRKALVRASQRLRKVTQNVMASNPSNGESSKKTSARKRGAAALEKLDLNVEFSNNEVEEPAAQTMSDGNGTANGEEDTIEGISFFEGLDEFLSSLPILNVAADDKVKAN